MAISLTNALRSQEPIIQNLMQFYTHDFSEFWMGTAKGDLRDDGKFDPYPMEEYWSRPNWSAQLVWNDGILAGFALINDRTHFGEVVNRNVGEFFILRKHRGQGIGRMAAVSIFAQHPGSWEVAVARKNLKALNFWRKTIRGTAEASDVREIDMHDDRWNGPLFRFNWIALT